MSRTRAEITRIRREGSGKQEEEEDDRKEDRDVGKMKFCDFSDFVSLTEIAGCRRHIVT